MSLEELIKRLSCVQERRMRAVALAERLVAVGERAAALILAHIISRKATAEDIGIRLLRDALLDLEALRQCLGCEMVARIRQVSQAMGLEEVLDLFDERGGFRCAQDEDLPMTVQEFRGVTLGARKAMARQPTDKWLDKLLHDQDPGVIRNLLLNPRVTEAEVLKIASRTPVSSRVLQEVANSRRWISRYRVKKALVLNPYTPLSISLPLLRFLLMQDLSFVAERDGLSPSLRLRARELWKQRRQREAAEDSHLAELDI